MFLIPLFYPTTLCLLRANRQPPSRVASVPLCTTSEHADRFDEMRREGSDHSDNTGPARYMRKSGTVRRRGAKRPDFRATADGATLENTALAETRDS